MNPHVSCLENVEKRFERNNAQDAYRLYRSKQAQIKIILRHRAK